MNSPFRRFQPYAENEHGDRWAMLKGRLFGGLLILAASVVILGVCGGFR